MLAETTWVQGKKYYFGDVVGVGGSLCTDLAYANTANPATDSAGSWYCTSSSFGSLTGNPADNPALSSALNNKAAVNASTTVNGQNCPLGGSCIIGTSGSVNAMDSLSAAITSCGSAATTIQITQAITLGASLTVPANCTLWFQTGGELLPTSGVTLTVDGPIQAPSTQQIFGGAGAVALGTTTREIPAAWFGAVGDGATNNLAALQAAANAAYPGTDIRLSMGTYLIGGALSLPTGVGINGATFANDTPPLTKLLSTSASADIIDISANTNNCRVTNMEVGRTVLPNPGTHGISVVGISGGYLLSNLWVADSYSDLYYNHGPTGYHGTIGVSAVWGQNGVSGYPSGALLNGFEIDSENSQPADSQVMEFVGAGLTPSGTVTTAINIHGQTIQDINIRNVNSGSTSHGLVITYDGSLTFDSAYDIHINHATFDACSIDCVQINNLPSIGSVMIDDLYAVGASGSNPAVSINNSQGVVINGAEIGNDGGGTGIEFSGGSLNQLLNSTFNFMSNTGNNGAGQAVVVLNSSFNTFSNLSFIGWSTNVMEGMFAMGGTSRYNAISNLRGDGYSSNGFYAASTAGPNQLVNVDFAHGANNHIANQFLDQSNLNHDISSFIASTGASQTYWDISFNGNHTDGSRLGCLGDTAGVDKTLYCDAPTGGFLEGRVGVNGTGNGGVKYVYGGLTAPAIGASCTSINSGSGSTWLFTDDGVLRVCKNGVVASPTF